MTMSALFRILFNVASLAMLWVLWLIVRKV